MFTFVRDKNQVTIVVYAENQNISKDPHIENTLYLFKGVFIVTKFDAVI